MISLNGGLAESLTEAVVSEEHRLSIGDLSDSHCGCSSPLGLIEKAGYRGPELDAWTHCDRLHLAIFRNHAHFNCS